MKKPGRRCSSISISTKIFPSSDEAGKSIPKSNQEKGSKIFFPAETNKKISLQSLIKEKQTRSFFSSGEWGNKSAMSKKEKVFPSSDEKVNSTPKSNKGKGNKSFFPVQMKMKKEMQAFSWLI